MEKEKKIVDAWRINSDSWISSIDNSEIESRNLITNSAILKCIKGLGPESALDLGCGEGWLTREMMKLGIRTVGIDGSEVLIKNARSKGHGDFYQVEYDEIIAGKLESNQRYNLIVFNYSLFGDKQTEDLLAFLKNSLLPCGNLLIQTIHPDNKSFVNLTGSGWIKESGNAANLKFQEPYEWYFRTLNDWKNLFYNLGYKDVQITPTHHPNSGDPISIILTVSTC